MDELLEQFLIESRELMTAVSADFTVLARTPQATGSIDGAFRAVHTLKGSVALFAMLPAERVLHAAEDILERARKGMVTLDQAILAALVASLDQIDRWIDELERTGGLAESAAAIADAVISALTKAAPALPGLSPSASGSEGWVGDLLAREAAVITGTDRPVTAFRYAPDADCFFRGDDPLAVAAGVPELLSLAILPATGAWPAPEAIEPFSCFTVLEGLSAAPLDAVSAAFRLMPDQVQFAAIDPARDRADEGAGEGELRSKRSLRVDAARIDALGDALGELLVAVTALAPLAREAGRLEHGLGADLHAAHGTLERVASDLYRSVSAVRSVALEPALRRLPRLAREIAESLGKSVQFEITGQGIEIDKQIADGLFEPLLHLLRNAIDHGIEAREKRAAAGKPPSGRVTLDFARDGDMVIAQLSDDGAGIDAAGLRRSAVERGVVTAEAAEALGDAAALRLIFVPGFSTAAAVTEVSGRGVGMDAVQAAIEMLRGSIEIESTAGAGTTIRMRLPANALTTRLLVIEVGGDRYGVALDQVVETVGIANDRLMPIGGGTACVLHGRTVPVLDLAALLGGAGRERAVAKLLVTQAGGELVALRVDGFAERIDTLVRQPSGILAAVPGVSGSTLLSDGGVLLVLDLPELAA